MSWSIRVVGTKEFVKAQVTGNTHIPDNIKAVIATRVDALPAAPRYADAAFAYAVSLNTHGSYHDEGGNHTVELSLVPAGFAIAVSPPPAVPAG